MANPYTRSSPLNIEENHKLLLEFICSRMESYRATRDLLVDTFTSTDTQLSGWLEKSGEEAKIDASNRQGTTTSPIKEAYPFAEAQLDEAATLLLNILIPDTTPFEAIGPADQQTILKAFSTLMNKNAQKMGLFAEVHAGISNLLRHNFGAWFVLWETIKEMQVPGVVNSKEFQWEGNKVRSADIYNLFMDPFVTPDKLAEEGEFVAEVTLVSDFTLRKREKNLTLFDAMNGMNKNSTKQANILNYYAFPPQYKTGKSNQTAGPGNLGYYENTIFGHNSRAIGNLQSMNEVVEYYGWLVPSEYGMSDSKELELWNITLVNGLVKQHQKLNYFHHMLPCVAARPILTKAGSQEKSHAQRLIPMQILISHILNTFTSSTRKSLYGITLYDKAIINRDLRNDVDRDELVNALIGVELTGVNKDKKLTDVFMQLNNAPDTDKLLPQISAVMELMQKILPTDSLRQVADLDRATQYQAAATVQASNRRGAKLALLIDAQAFSKIRTQLVANIKAFQKKVEITGPNQEKVEVIPESFREIDIDFHIGHGLKGLDRLIVVNSMMEIVSRVLQSQEAIQEIDIVKLLDYVSTLAGDNTDLEQFRRILPPNGVIPEGTNPPQ